MTVLRPSPILPTSMFHWSGTAGTAEASSLSRTFQHALGNVYDDACDVGFTMLSDSSGREVVFRLENIRRGDDGILSWEFSSLNPPGIPRMVVTVFND